MKTIASAPNLVDQVTQAVLDEITSGRAAEQQAERAARIGPALIEAGRRAVAARSRTRMIAADTRFHECLYSLSGNPLVAPALATHLTCTQRVMGEVLEGDEQPVEIWDQHERILMAISAGDAPLAESLARAHIGEACDQLVARLRQAA